MPFWGTACMYQSSILLHSSKLAELCVTQRPVHRVLFLYFAIEISRACKVKVCHTPTGV